MIESLYTAVSGMMAMQTGINVTANNISNVNTTGFKRSRTFYKDAYYKTVRYPTPPSTATNLGGVNPSQQGLGTAVQAIQRVHTQGVIEQTYKASNMAIMGDGFFVVKDNVGNTKYTRDGAFEIDSQNRLVTNTGEYVMGWNARDDGSGNMVIDNSGAIERIDIPVGQLTKAKATTNVDYGGNLDASTTTQQYDTSVTVYDSLGQAHSVTLSYTKAAADTWTWSAAKTFPTDTTFNIAGISGGTVTYTTEGQYDATNPAQRVTISLTNGSTTPQTINLDMTKTTQLDATDIDGAPSSDLTASYQDGYAMGTLINYNVGLDGIINGIYSNGIVESLAGVATANFINPTGLEQVGNNQFLKSSNSGEPMLGFASTGGRGQVIAGSVEISNVDVAEEFVKLIVTQRAFQANTRVINTSDEMLQEILNLKR